MQTATGTLAAAIAAAEQQPVHTVTVDWDSDGVNSTANMIPDPDFELGTGLTSWSGYVPGGGFLANTTYRDVASGASIPETGGTAPTAQSGSKMRFVAFGAPGSTGGMHGIRLLTTVGQQYTATFRVQIPTSPASGTVLRLRAWDKGALVADSTTTSTTASWVTLTVTWLPTSQYTWIGIYATGTAAAQVYAFVDNVSVTPSGQLLTIDDLSLAADTVTVDRSLNTDLPDSAQLVTGYAAAEATIELGDGTDGRSSRSQFSPYDPAGPLYGKQEIRRPVTVRLGHRSTAGPETLPAFSGFLRSVQTHADGTVTVTALDGAEKMRGAATVPIIAANDGAAVASPSGRRPGLNSQWLIDYLARKAGYYATPPARSRCALSVTMHGSAAPEVGTMQRVGWDKNLSGATYASVALPFRQGKFGLAMDSGANPASDFFWAVYSGDSNQLIALNNGATIFMECWFYADAATVNDHSRIFTLVRGDNNATQASNLLNLSVFNGSICCGISRGTLASTYYAGPAAPTDNAWHYAAIQATFSANGSTVDIQYRLDGATTTRTALAGGGNLTGQPTFDEYYIAFSTGAGLSVEAAQVTTEDSTAPWNDSFTPTAILDAGLNELIVTPVVSAGADRWELIQQIVAAEYGVAMFDETGRFVFRNAKNLRQNSTIAATLTSMDSLLDVEVDRAADQIRNRITATVKTPTIGAFADAYTPIAIPSVAAHSTITIVDTLTQTYAGLDGTVLLQWFGVNWTNPSTSSFVVNSSPDGGGTVITSGVTVNATVLDGTTLRLDITNNTNNTVFLVWPSSSTNYPPGTPGLVMRGYPVDYNGPEKLIDLTDAASADPNTGYGEQAYAVGSSDWAQRTDIFTPIYTDLLYQLRKPRPLLTGVRVIEDCRLQLGDRIVLADAGGLTLGEEYFVVGIRTERSDSGAEQSLTLRQVTFPGGWVLGRAGRMKLGSQTRLL